MLVQPTRSRELHLVPRPLPAQEPKVAVVLNANARRVTDRVVRALSHVVAPEDLFLSNTLGDCRRLSQTVLERRYDIVFTGGGDGTFIGFLNELNRQLEQRNRYHPQGAPRFGILKLGTGNGLASLVSASSSRNDGFVDDVLRARAGEIPGYRTLDMVTVDGRKTHFAGLGVDAHILNDYIWVKENFGKGMLKPAMTGIRGYLASVALRTVPHYLSTPSLVECEVFNGRSGPAYRLNPDGSTLGEIAPGELLYRGRLMMCAAATIPFYGFAIRMFPFAGRRRGHMHLRLAAVKALQTVANIPKLWAGRWFPENRVFDYHVSEYTVRFARPMAFQIGGDAEGFRTEVSMSVAPDAVELVDFTGALH